MTILAILMLAVLFAAVIGCSLWAARSVEKFIADGGPEYIADAPMVYVPPNLAERFKAIADEITDLPSYEQLAELYLIPEETR